MFHMHTHTHTHTNTSNPLPILKNSELLPSHKKKHLHEEAKEAQEANDEPGQESGRVLHIRGHMVVAVGAMEGGGARSKLRAHDCGGLGGYGGNRRRNVPTNALWQFYELSWVGGWRVS